MKKHQMSKVHEQPREHIGEAIFEMPGFVVSILKCQFLES